MRRAAVDPHGDVSGRGRGDVAELAGGVGVGAWTALAVLTMVVVGGAGAPLFLDSGLLSWSVAHRPDAAVTVARGVTATGTGLVPYTLIVLAALSVGRTARQRVTAVLLGLGCLLAGQLTRAVIMVLTARPRPPHSDWVAHASGWAFPSGHTTTSALTAGLLLLALRLRAPRGRKTLGAAVCLWAVLVGLSRIYLGVHWFTDVVGGWLFATGWLGLCLAAAARWLPARLVAGTAGRPDPDPDAAL